jgi:integrase
VGMPHPPHTKQNKPEKPYPDFPLFWHSRGYWTRKIDGRTPSFGTEWRKALERLEAYKLERTSATPAVLEQRAATVRNCVNQFFTRQYHRYESRELDLSSLTRCRNSIERFAKVVGGSRYVTELMPGDFGRYRRKITKDDGFAAFNRDRVYIRAMFDWAFSSQLIAAPPRVGDEFDPVNKSVLRRAKAKDVLERGHKEFTPEQIREMLEVSKDRPTLYAMLLLAINGGMGNGDISSLTRTAVNFKAGVISYPRVKTGIDRIIPLWPETVTALEGAVRERPKPARAEYRDRVFLTESNNFKSDGGLPYVRQKAKLDKAGIPKSTTHIDGINQRFKGVLKRCKLEGRGLSFNVLRATFRTIALGAHRPEAVKIIMGHQLSGMDEHYVRSIKLELLRDVVNHVHATVFPVSKSQ